MFNSISQSLNNLSFNKIDIIEDTTKSNNNLKIIENYLNNNYINILITDHNLNIKLSKTFTKYHTTHHNTNYINIITHIENFNINSIYINYNDYELLLNDNSYMNYINNSYIIEGDNLLHKLFNYIKSLSPNIIEIINHEYKNYTIINHEIINHEIINHEIINQEIINHEYKNHEYKNYLHIIICVITGLSSYITFTKLNIQESFYKNLPIQIPIQIEKILNINMFKTYLSMFSSISKLTNGLIQKLLHCNITFINLWENMFNYDKSISSEIQSNILTDIVTNFLIKISELIIDNKKLNNSIISLENKISCNKISCENSLLDKISVLEQKINIIERKSNNSNNYFDFNEKIKTLEDKIMYLYDNPFKLIKITNCTKKNKK